MSAGNIYVRDADIEISELKSRIKALEDAANYTVNVWFAGSMEGTDDGIEALAALLNTQDEG